MSKPTSDDILIRIDTIDQLFNAPDANPFSDKPAIILGEAAMLHAVRRGLATGDRNWQGRRLIVQLPADQISPILQQQLIEAIRRYAATKKAENDILIRLSRQRSLFGLAIALIVAGILLATLAIIVNTVLSSASDIVKGILAGITTIFIWVTIWNPWEGLLYDWVEPALENRILKNITSMQVIIQAEPRAVDGVFARPLP